MPIEPARIEEIFIEASSIAEAAARAAYLDQACGDDMALRERAEALLAAHDSAGSFLELADGSDAATVAFVRLSEGPGTKIGRYKLLEEIGEGGFGVVFMAEQEEPVRRRVALKVIKPGMDTREVVARFEAERQALAMMDHPNIAKVHDAGATENGRPYFVMELVHGVPITEYCDQCNLTTNERLALFVTVCQAVQHAHQKGVIHRDIKPTNVLVAMQDGRPVPKIIDFGVAKAINQRLTEHTLLTAYAQIVGTPLYMSPEQAELSPLGVDTRSDIYSLGVLLYELLAGATPFDKDRLHVASYDELRRIIREEEPPRPSARISTLAADLADTVAEHRRTDARRLRQVVRGELDWIVMKCLDKDRNRRYDAAGSLARDIGRYLTDQPVEARRPTRAYRLRKFARRNKLAILASTVILAAISLGLAATSYFAARASREAKHATAALAQAELNSRTAQGINTFFTEEVYGLADPNRSNNPNVTLLEALDIAAGKIDAKFPNDPVLRSEILDQLGGIYIGIDKPNKAVPHLQHAVDLRRSFAGDSDPSTLKSRSLLGWALHRGGRWEEAHDILKSVMDEQTIALGMGNPDTLQTANEFVILLTELRGYLVAARAEDPDLEIAQNAYDAALATLGPKHFATLRAENTLSLVLRWRKRPADGLPYARAAAIGLTEVAGRDNPETMFAIYDHCVCLCALERYDEAIAELKPLVAVRNRVLGPLHFDSLYASTGLAVALRSSGDSAGSLAVLEDVYAHLMRSPELPNWRRVKPILNIAEAYRDVGRDDRAAELISLVDRILSSVTADEAAPAAYADSLDQLARSFSDPASAKTRNVDRGIQLATKACELTNFRNDTFINTLMGAYLEKGDADETAEFVQRATANAKRLTNPSASADALYYIAVVQARLGNNAGYRATCRALVDLPLDNADASAKSRPIWTSCIAPNSLDDFTPVVTRAEGYLENDADGNRHYGLALLGAALFRAGKYEQAAKRLEESSAALHNDPRIPGTSFEVKNYQQLLLAMATWQLGQHDEARRQLAETQRAIDKELQSSPSWNRRATLEILRAEAEALIEKDRADEATNKGGSPLASPSVSEL